MAFFEPRGRLHPRRIRPEWTRMRSLIGLDIDLYSEMPRGYGKLDRDASHWRAFLYLCVASHSFPPIVIYRFQVFFYDIGLRPIATALSRLNDVIFNVSIGTSVRTHGALEIAHGHVVIDGFTVLGHHVQISPCVTLGGTNSSQRAFDLRGPTIGDHVNIGAGAKIIGPVTVGSHVKIGANAVVIDDVPDHHTAVGVPARVFPTKDGPVQGQWV